MLTKVSNKNHFTNLYFYIVGVFAIEKSSHIGISSITKLCKRLQYKNNRDIKEIKRRKRNVSFTQERENESLGMLTYLLNDSHSNFTWDCCTSRGSIAKRC